MAPDNKKNVLILGGGFAGIKVALELAKSQGFAITLLSDQDNFRYYPSLYHTATGNKQTASSIPLTEIFNGKPVKLIKDSAQALDRQAKSVKGSADQTYSFDILIIALGVVTNYFGIKGLEKFAYGIKSQEDAKTLRDHIHKQLVDEKKPDLNYVVIGGGPTGVELAGALPSYIQHVMKKHGITDTKLHIDLVEATPKLMGRMSPGYSNTVQRRLRKLGIELYLGQAVEAESIDALQVGDHNIASHTVIWTAGVTNHPFFKSNAFKLSEHGKVTINEQLQAEPDIYVIGDNADTPYSGMAQTALYDATFLATNLKRGLAGKAATAYAPKKPIYVTPVGPGWAAVAWGKVQLFGRLGSMLRSAADLRGYHDYEPWWLASKHWLAEGEEDKDCPTCD